MQRHCILFLHIIVHENGEHYGREFTNIFTTSQQYKIFAFFEKLKQSIYTPIAQLNAFVHKSTEPICFDDIKTSVSIL